MSSCSWSPGSGPAARDVPENVTLPRGHCHCHADDMCRQQVCPAAKLPAGLSSASGPGAGSTPSARLRLLPGHAQRRSVTKCSGDACRPPQGRVSSPDKHRNATRLGKRTPRYRPQRTDGRDSVTRSQQHRSPSLKLQTTQTSTSTRVTATMWLTHTLESCLATEGTKHRHTPPRG